MSRATDNDAPAAGLVEAPTLSDEWIASKWPDEDAGEIRRRFDALLARLGESPWKGMPRCPDVMLPVLAWAALLPSERIEILVETLSTVPDHLRDYKWVAKKPAFGEQRVKFGEVVGDNGHGMGRQAVAVTPYVKGYNLAPWIAAASPGNVGALLAELERLRHALAALQAPQEAGVSVKAATSQCERCQGNGEIVVDWKRYRHPRAGDVGDEAVAECPDCNGEGEIVEAEADAALSQPVATPAPSQDAAVVRLEGEIARLEDELSEARQTWPEWARRVYAFMRKYGFYESSEDDIHLPDDLEGWFDETIETEVNSRLAATRPAEAQAPEGWKLVPEQATVEMVAAFWRQKNTGTQEIGGLPGNATSDFDAYRAMLAASPATGGA